MNGTSLGLILSVLLSQLF